MQHLISNYTGKFAAEGEVRTRQFPRKTGRYAISSQTHFHLRDGAIDIHLTCPDQTDVACLLIVFLIAFSAVAGAEEGMASYYSDSLDGNPTANGESYDRIAMTAAHRTLPFGTMVKVTNLLNDKSVVVRINDRGPHIKDRIIDVSGAAAKKLGLLDSGTARVRIEKQ